MSTSHIAENLSATGASSEVKGRTATIIVKSNSFVGTYEIQNKIDSTSDWQTSTSTDGTAHTFTDTGCNVVGSSAGRCRWCINVSAYTSGSIDVSIKRGDDSVAG